MKALMFLTVAISCIVASSSTAYTHQDYCPDFGELNVKYEAVVLDGSYRPPYAGGCFSKEIVPNGGSGDHRLNMWLNVAPTYGNFCHEAVVSESQFFQYSCISSWKNNNKGKSVMFMRLYDRAARHGRLAARCAIYEKISKTSAIMRIALEDHIMCKNLGEEQNRVQHTNFSLKSNWTDEPVVFLLSLANSKVPVEKVHHVKTPKIPFPNVQNRKQLNITVGELSKALKFVDMMEIFLANLRIQQENNNKDNMDSVAYNTLGRSRRAIETYNFPFWSQGCWVNLCIKDDTATFDESVLYASEADDTDYQEGTERDAEKSENSQKVRRDSKPVTKLLDISKRIKRSSKQVLQSSKTVWRNIMPVHFDDHPGQPKNTFRYLIMGGNHVSDEHNSTGDATSNNRNKSDSMLDGAVKENVTMYACMWITVKDRNIIQYAIPVAKSGPTPDQDLLSFAINLCKANKVVNYEIFRPHPQRWITETRKNASDRVLVSCPVTPGTVFYGKLPLPPTLPADVDAAAGPSTEPPLDFCVKLISSVDDVTPGQGGFSDQMKYTVSKCVDPTSLTGISSQPMSTQVINEEREYKCLGQWTENRPIGQEKDGKRTTLTYMYVERLDGSNADGEPEYECYVVTSIPNQPGQDPRAMTLLLAEAGRGTHCSLLADPYVDGMKLVGTRIDSEGAMPAGGKSWFPLKPQQINPENAEGKWYASPPVPVSGQNPTTMTPIVTGRHTGGNGALHTPRQHQTPRPPPSQASIGNRTVRDRQTMVGLLLSITLSLW